MLTHPPGPPLQLLSAALPRERIAAFHLLMEGLGTAGILPGFPPGGSEVRGDAPAC